LLRKALNDFLNNARRFVRSEKKLVETDAFAFRAEEDEDTGGSAPAFANQPAMIGSNQPGRISELPARHVGHALPRD
jgi:hypothetical protein